MSVYVNINTKEYPRYEGDIRLIHPEIGEKFICPPCFVEVEQTEKPSCGEYEYCLEGPIEEKNGKYKQTWIIEPLTEELKLMRDTLPKPEEMIRPVWDYENKIWVDLIPIPQSNDTSEE